MPTVRILDTDHWRDVAKKIYEQFEVFQTCTISGFEFDEEDNIIWKADQVLKELVRLDEVDNVTYAQRVRVRKRTKMPKSIGGWVAQKIFRYEREEDDRKIVKANIWRIQ